MKDILLDDNGNLVTNGSELVVGDASEQVVQQVVSAFTGEYKNAPMIGGNARGMVAGTPDPFWPGSIKGQLKQCLVEVDKVTVSDDNIEIKLK